MKVKLKYAGTDRSVGPVRETFSIGPAFAKPLTKRERYQAENPDQPTKRERLSEADVAALVAAVMSLDVMQWVKLQMAAELAPGEGGGEIAAPEQYQRRPNSRISREQISTQAREYAISHGTTYEAALAKFGARLPTSIATSRAV